MISAGSLTEHAHGSELVGILFDMVPVGIAVYGRDARLERFNNTWADLMQHGAEYGCPAPAPGVSRCDLAAALAQSTLPLFVRALEGETIKRVGLRVEYGGQASYWDVEFRPLFVDGVLVNIVESLCNSTERVLAYSDHEAQLAARTQALERRQAVAESMRDTVALLNSSLSLHDILKRLASQCRDLLNADCSAIFNLSAPDKLLRVEAFDGAADTPLDGYTLPVGVGAVGKAVLTGEPVVIENLLAALPTLLADLSARCEPKDAVTMGATLRRVARSYGAALAVPLIVREEICGGIALYFKAPRHFSLEDMELAGTFAHQAALAIENARLRKQIEAAAVAAERNRIARDLHDSVTQTLFSASLIGEVLPGLWARNPEEGRKRVQELRQLTRGALAEMRMLLLELRPAQIYQVSLRDLLEHLVEATMSRSSIPIALNIDGEGSIPPPVHNSLYRIAQEALNNVAKHSGATEASISLRYMGNEVELQVIDNGRGFDPAHITGEHLGVTIMRERSEEIGAVLDFKSCPAGGTCVQVRWQPHSNAGS